MNSIQCAISHIAFSSCRLSLLEQCYPVTAIFTELSYPKTFSSRRRAALYDIGRVLSAYFARTPLPNISIIIIKWR
jgi:hypothetical protein